MVLKSDVYGINFGRKKKWEYARAVDELVFIEMHLCSETVMSEPTNTLLHIEP